MFLLNPDLSAFVFPHPLHALPEALWPRDVSYVKLYAAFATIRARVEDGLVVKVGNVLDLAQVTKHGLFLALS